MPKLFAFFSKEAHESLGDETLFYATLANGGGTVTATHISEDESGKDYFWLDKKFVGEVIEKDNTPQNTLFNNPTLTIQELGTPLYNQTFEQFLEEAENTRRQRIRDDFLRLTQNRNREMYEELDRQLFDQINNRR